MCFKHIGAHKKMCQNVFTVAVVNDADIHGAIRESIHLAGNLTSGKKCAEVTFAFNGILVTVTEESVTDDIYQMWQHARPGASIGPYMSKLTMAQVLREELESNSSAPVPA